jgi:hypothetical protein
MPSGGTQAVVLLPGLLVPPVGPDEPQVIPLDTAAFTGGDPRRHATGPVYVPAQATSPDEIHGYAPPSDPLPSEPPYTGPAQPEPPAAQPYASMPALAPAPVPAAPPAPEPAAGPIAGPAGGLTGRGLPQRVRGSAAGAHRAAPAAPAAPVDADELRRRLEGLQRGLQAGRADAVREQDGSPAGPRGLADPAGTVEEATR